MLLADVEFNIAVYSHVQGWYKIYAASFDHETLRFNEVKMIVLHYCNNQDW